MRLKSLCLLPLIFGWIFWEGNCRTFLADQSLNNFLSKTLCDSECHNNASCQRNCRETKKIKVLDEEAGANARVLCQDDDFLLLAHNMGPFVVEQRTRDWNAFSNTGSSDSNTTIHYRGDNPLGYHHIVVYRLLRGGISKPEKTIVVPLKPDGFRLKPVPSVKLGRSLYIDAGRDRGKWTQEISFTPSEDRPCYYEVTCQQENGNYSETIDIAESEIFNVTFNGLPPEGDFTVSVRALTKALKENHSLNIIATSVTFTTRLHKNLGILIPCLVGTILVVIGTGFGVYKYIRIRRLKLTYEVDEFEISPNRLVIERVLGTGAFGVVKLGKLRDDQGHRIDVAVKMLRDDSNKDHTHSFHLEIKMMKTLGKHPNIVSMLGCRTIGPYPFLVLEYCSRGDLHSFLRKSLVETTVSNDETNKCVVANQRHTEVIVTQGEFNQQGFSTESSDGDVDVSVSVKDQDTTCHSNIITIPEMLNFGRQIAKGMEFLSSNKIVHRDLAARNILVCDDRTVKISDFGLSRNVCEKNIYKKCGNGRMPLKWLAVESLTHQVYSIHSDVWSFGVLLWEIMTLGGDPYPGVPTIEILNQLHSGYRMEKPENCSVPLYNVMLSCWQTRPKDRPAFDVLHQELDKIISANAQNTHSDLVGVPEEMLIELDDVVRNWPTIRDRQQKEKVKKKQGQNMS